jgi:hypothetical protein
MKGMNLIYKLPFLVEMKDSIVEKKSCVGRKGN